MPKMMWQPSNEEIAKSNMTRFMNYVNEVHRLKLANYKELYKWSIDHKADFWESVWYFSGVIASKEAERIYSPSPQIQNTKWFLGARLNFAENLLRKKDDSIALIFNNEANRKRLYTYNELYSAVAKVAHYLREAGVKKNDRVAAVLPNIPETVIAMLATTSIGAIWSSSSPEFGKDGLFDRFDQITPKILFTCVEYSYNGKKYDISEKISWLQKKISSLQKIILVANPDDPNRNDFPNSELFDDLITEAEKALIFEQLPFDHPVYIMYSSGTTGIPKCIVHGAGGTLLQHSKELILHTNLSQEDNIFYFTTCGWMMWNWYISSLVTGAALTQYDGAAFYPTPTRLIDLIDEEKISVFGTSAKYISGLEKHAIKPIATHDLSSLKTILSTGSPLVQANYEYVYKNVKKDVRLCSISGGTDIISCFALGNPNLPIYCGELQCRGLGMNVEVFNENGKSVIEQKGELVCTGAFPPMPIYFWNDPEGKKYKEAYFSKFENVWTHGDFAEITRRDTVIIYGRSDATLNPTGVRIGTAEIYRQIEKFPEIIDCLAVSQDWEDDVRIILFVVMKPYSKLTDELKFEIKNSLRNNCSPRHVPAKIIEVTDIPRTLSGKTVELAVREIIHNRTVKNLSAIANPESLNNFKNLAELQVK